MDFGRGEIFFSAKPDDCKPKIYIIYVHKVVEREDLDSELAVEAELQSTFLVQVFHEHLHAHPSNKRGVEKGSRKLFPYARKSSANPTTAEDDALTLVSDTCRLIRNKNESPRALVEHTGKLHLRMLPHFGQTLLTGFILRIRDGGKDKNSQAMG
ncbi:hypothetical protein AU210_016486 [Fusarium oxysporum f. sp. radicis-cucumerinum]|uniref:Uncharacterized protein n=1 Tax=Fusarium oxysporum f. sp. radicis-cucumerinum TaxID=327505 RepID=A0A2H3FS75_FUSOX|nr:hypothetical protein AU210_016486 [Fusarium oxysporum f. sp. radicis-cucumerinum]